MMSEFGCRTSAFLIHAHWNHWYLLNLDRFVSILALYPTFDLMKAGMLDFSQVVPLDSTFLDYSVHLVV